MERLTPITMKPVISTNTIEAAPEAFRLPHFTGKLERHRAQKRCKRGKLISTCPKLFPIAVRHRRLESYKFLGVEHSGQFTEHSRAHVAVHRRSNADADRQAGNCRNREARRARQQSDGETEILKDGFEPTLSAHA